MRIGWEQLEDDVEYDNASYDFVEESSRTIQRRHDDYSVHRDFVWGYSVRPTFPAPLINPPFTSLTRLVFPLTSLEFDEDDSNNAPPVLIFHSALSFPPPAHRHRVRNPLPQRVGLPHLAALSHPVRPFCPNTGKANTDCPHPGLSSMPLLLERTAPFSLLEATLPKLQAPGKAHGSTCPECGAPSSTTSWCSLRRRGPNLIEAPSWGFWILGARGSPSCFEPLGRRVEVEREDGVLA